jgi:hypothetical protein
MVPPIKPPGRRTKQGLFGPLRRIPVEKLYEFGIQESVLKKILFAFGLVLLYIGNNHMAAKLVYRLERMRSEVEDLRVDYNSTKFSYMYNTKQSEVAERMRPYSVEESSVPPRKVPVKKEGKR